ncbi:MAG: neutral zinc metallopeptidase [Pseudomonadota bacterium]
MDGVDASLRHQINGPVLAKIEPVRRRRFGERDVVRAKLLSYGGILAAAAGIIMAVLLGLYGGSDESAETAETVADTPSSEAVAAANRATSSAASKITTIDSRVLVSDGGSVTLVEPIGLASSSQVDRSKEPPAATKLEPVRPELKIAEVEAGGSDAAFATLTDNASVAAAKLEGASSAILVARSNLVWARVFAQAGLHYSALKRSPLAAWASSACSMRAVPTRPTYCTLDQTVYADDVVPPGPVALLELANQIGSHVQENLGVSFRPANGEARHLRSDCFAGLWAQLDRGGDTVLAPGLLRNALAVDDQLSFSDEARLTAFVTGYTGTTPRDCEMVGQRS